MGSYRTSDSVAGKRVRVAVEIAELSCKVHTVMGFTLGGAATLLWLARRVIESSPNTEKLE